MAYGYKHISRILKLAPRLFGPFQAVERIEKLTSQLNLPSKAQNQPAFHVISLKRQIGAKSLSPRRCHQGMSQRRFNLNLKKIMARQMKNMFNRSVIQVLIKWNEAVEENNTWQLHYSLRVSYTHLVDECFKRGRCCHEHASEKGYYGIPRVVGELHQRWQINDRVCSWGFRDFKRQEWW